MGGSIQEEVGGCFVCGRNLIRLVFVLKPGHLTKRQGRSRVKPCWHRICNFHCYSVTFVPITDILSLKRGAGVLHNCQVALAAYLEKHFHWHWGPLACRTGRQYHNKYTT